MTPRRKKEFKECFYIVVEVKFPHKHSPFLSVRLISVLRGNVYSQLRVGGKHKKEKRQAQASTGQRATDAARHEMMHSVGQTSLLPAMELEKRNMKKEMGKSKNKKNVREK